MIRSRASLMFGILAGLGVGLLAGYVFAARGGQLTLVVTDRDTGAPIACRMHLKNARNLPNKPPKLPFWHDHFVFDGEITLTLPVGEYNFELERGPEYLNRVGHFTINDFAEDTHKLDLKRVVDMQKEGWWSGDLFVDRPEKDMPLVLEAEDLHLAQLVGPGDAAKTTAGHGASSAKPPSGSASKPSSIIGKSSKSSKSGGASAAKSGWTLSPDGSWALLPDNRCFGRHGHVDSRGGNLLIVANLAAPWTESDTAPVWSVAEKARQSPNAWLDAGRAFSWDLPLLVAEGAIDSVELANCHFGRTSTIMDEAGGRPRDPIHYAGEGGLGRWSETIYYHLLNCGLRLPPSAGSGSGQMPNPTGYDRMYVQLDDEFSVEKWWRGFKAGRVVVTNGPLLRPLVEGEYPGHVFAQPPGETHEFEIALTLSTRDPVDYLEIVQNGNVVHMVRLAEWVEQKGRLPKVSFDKSGWFLVRAITQAVGTYRFASSGPYYVEVEGKPSVSKKSAQFFIDWLDERSSKLKPSEADAPEARRRFDAARAYWRLAGRTSHRRISRRSASPKPRSRPIAHMRCARCIRQSFHQALATPAFPIQREFRGFHRPRLAPCDLRKSTDFGRAA